MNEITETKLPVAKFNFSEASLMSWKELFHGFDKLEAITYSSSLSFMNKVLETFNEATIILGTEQNDGFSNCHVTGFEYTVFKNYKQKEDTNS